MTSIVRKNVRFIAAERNLGGKLFPLIGNIFLIRDNLMLDAIAQRQPIIGPLEEDIASVL
jgi:hypothetical protein